MKEKRALQRFTMELPIRISLNTNGNDTVCLKTSDISARGAFIGTGEPYPVGTQLKMEVFLLTQNGAKDDIIRTMGKVIRTGATGMAVRFDENYQILPIEYYPEH